MSSACLLGLVKNHSTYYENFFCVAFSNVKYRLPPTSLLNYSLSLPVFMNNKSIRLKLYFTIAAMVACSYFFAQQGVTDFKREPFYAALSSATLNKIDEQLKLVEKTGITEKSAYEGTLMMKKSGLISGASKKLNLFKEGSKKLESAISKDINNTEYRFLRLMIQENAPSILGYKNNIKEDSDLVRKDYNKLSETVQKAILNYNKVSKSLRIVGQ